MVLQLFLWFYLCLSTSDTLTFVRGQGQRSNEASDDSHDITNPQTQGFDKAKNYAKMDTSEDIQAKVEVPAVVPILETQEIENELDLAPSEIHRRYYNSLLGHTILPRDPSFILNGAYLSNPSALCSQHDDLDLAVVVHTSPYNFRRRDMLRSTFNNPAITFPYTVQLVFIIGTHNTTNILPDKEKILRSEMNKYNDFVQMDFNEDFRNLSLKAATWLRWVNESCPQAMMVLKIDDDVVIDLRRVLPWSRGYFSKFKRSIVCNVNKIGSQPIPRRGRTVVDPREFFNVTHYPYTYCSGFFVLLSRDIVPILANGVHQTPFYNVDDVYVFGMIPAVVGDVTFHNIGYNVSIWNQKVYNCTEEHGSNCRYFATMAKDEAITSKVLGAFEKAHASDFHTPQIHVYKRNKRP